MKNFGYTWQWGKNPEYTIDVCTHWGRWGLLLAIDLWHFNDAIENKCYGFGIDFLCFHFSMEIWKWVK